MLFFDFDANRIDESFEDQTDFARFFKFENKTVYTLLRREFLGLRENGTYFGENACLFGENLEKIKFITIF